MLDLNFVRDNLELVKQKMRERGLEEALGGFESLDRERRKFLVEAETRKARRNKVSDEIASLKKAKQDASALIAEMKQVGAEIEELDEKAKKYDEQLQELLRIIPNLPHASVPVGRGSEDNQEVRRWGTPRQFDFEPKAHWDLGPALGILDFGAHLLHFGDQGRGVLLRLFQGSDFVGNLIASRLARFRLQQKLTPLAINRFKPTKRFSQPALAHFLLHQLQIFTDKTQIEHVGSLLFLEPSI